MARFQLAIAVTTAIVPSVAHAHLGSSKFVVVERTEEGAHLAIAIEAVDASMELGMGEEPDEAAIGARAADVRGWIEEGLSVRGDGGPCSLRAGPVAFSTRDERRFVELEVTATCPAPVRELVFRDDTIFDDDPQHEAFVRVRFGDDDAARILRRGDREIALGDPPSFGGLVWTYLFEGALHLATGYDHVLFLLSLLLAAGLVAAREGTKKAMRDVALIVTAFTVGHSVTLVAAALEWVVLPSRLVESVIAASIVVVAALNLFRPDERRAIPWLAFGFGLIHGFGFSAVLAEQGLPRGHVVLALLSFNVGIELAQLAFVAVILAPLGWLARYDSYRPVVVRGGSVAIMALAGVWLVERAAGL